MFAWKSVRCLMSAALLATTTPALAESVAINNGSQFADTAGNAIQAHGAGIIKVDDTYYLFGENRTGYLFKAAACTARPT